MRYRVEWQASGELVIDTGTSGWTQDEVISQAEQAVASGAEGVNDRIEDEFDDCIVTGDDAWNEIKVTAL